MKHIRNVYSYQVKKNQDQCNPIIYDDILKTSLKTTRFFHVFAFSKLLPNAGNDPSGLRLRSHRFPAAFSEFQRVSTVQTAKISDFCNHLQETNPNRVETTVSKREVNWRCCFLVNNWLVVYHSNIWKNKKCSKPPIK